MKRIIASLAATFLAGAVVAAPARDEEPLDPDKAFRPAARLVAMSSGAASGSERHGIDIDYRITPGYYLYRSRIRFEVTPSTLLIGPPELPPGVEIEDQFVGKSAIYRDQVTIHLPFVVSVAKSGIYKVKITAQGCAEERICYTPFLQEVVVNIPPGYRVTDSQAPAPRGAPR
jgi:thiol:disulfide interchange protein DsbD